MQRVRALEHSCHSLDGCWRWSPFSNHLKLTVRPHKSCKSNDAECYPLTVIENTGGTYKVLVAFERGRSIEVSSHLPSKSITQPHLDFISAGSCTAATRTPLLFCHSLKLWSYFHPPSNLPSFHLLDRPRSSRPHPVRSHNASNGSGISRWKGLGCSKPGSFGIHLHHCCTVSHRRRHYLASRPLALQNHQLDPSSMLREHRSHNIIASGLFHLCITCISSQRTLQMRR